MKSFQNKPPNWFQRSLGTPLNAFSYTNETLMVFAIFGVLGGIFVVIFADDIGAMSQSIASLNEMEKKYLSEKISVMSTDATENKVIITITNYGKYDSTVLDVMNSVGGSMSCASNNSDEANFMVSSGDLLEISCVTDDPTDTPVYYVVTDSYNVIEVKP